MNSRRLTPTAPGFRALAIDFRGRGQSRGGSQAREDEEQFDVLAAVRYLRSLGVATVSVVGASSGGGAAALMAAILRCLSAE
jgi:pimeloyl-ACP methyl ester carboxylesterase